MKDYAPTKSFSEMMSGKRKGYVKNYVVLAVLIQATCPAHLF
jgi:hypothetical protein